MSLTFCLTWLFLTLLWQEKECASSALPAGGRSPSSLLSPRGECTLLVTGLRGSQGPHVVSTDTVVGMHYWLEGQMSWLLTSPCLTQQRGGGASLGSPLAFAALGGAAICCADWLETSRYCPKVLCLVRLSFSWSTGYREQALLGIFLRPSLVFLSCWILLL